jgi:DNA-binding transcriptional LysR family regulator
VDDLEDHCLMSWCPPGEDSTHWVRGGGEPVEVRPRFVSSDIHVVRALAISGEGIARLPDPPRFADELGGELETVMLDEFQRDMAFRLLLPETVAGAPRMRAALSVLTAFLEP